MRVSCLIDLDVALEFAVKEARKSPCRKSKRGVAVWGDPGDGKTTGERIVCAHNGPPPGFACDGTDACREACGKLCVHAEVRALMAAASGCTDLLHVKVVDGDPVPSGPPSCANCSKVILDRGIERVWLLHGPSVGPLDLVSPLFRGFTEGPGEPRLCAYSADDFHFHSLVNSELPVIRTPEPRRKEPGDP